MKIFVTFIILVILIFNNIYCSKESLGPQPQNHSPQILSLEIFPHVVGPSDSLIVICEAIDPDGDTLVYDWITTGVVRIKGYNHPWLYHTSENTRIFYAPDSSHVTAPQDTFWIQCIARDVKGGSAGGIVIFIVEKN